MSADARAFMSEMVDDQNANVQTGAETYGSTCRDHQNAQMLVKIWHIRPPFFERLEEGCPNNV